MMKNDSNRFAGEPHTPNPNAYINDGFDAEVMDPHARRNGHLPEDWNRVYWLLKAYERCTDERSHRSFMRYVANLRLLNFLTHLAQERQDALRRLPIEEKLYRVSIITWDDVAGHGAGPDPSTLSTRDNMRGIIASLQTTVWVRELEEDRLEAEKLAEEDRVIAEMLAEESCLTTLNCIY